MAAADDLMALLDEAERKLSLSELGAAGIPSLPVVVVIGPEGSTKTTVIVNSALDPELLAGQVFQDSAIAPTGLVNVWYAAPTVFVEIGRKVQADPNLWMRLMQRLKPRGGAPRVAVACYSCENFLKPDEAAVAGRAALQFRTKLNEVSKGMGVSLPVYVLFSKLDRTPLFFDFVRHLDDPEAAQVLGTTVPARLYAAGEYAERETGRLGKAFQDLVYALCDKRPEFLTREPDGAALGPVYEFPREFRKMRPVLVQFLVEMFRPSQLQPAPFLRGFYFCGVRPIVIQEQLPTPAAKAETVDPGKTRMFRLDELMAGTQAAIPLPRFTARKIPQWVFLNHFFSNVLLRDTAGLGAAAVRAKGNGGGGLLLAAIAAACLLVAAVLTISFLQNQALVQEIREAAIGIVRDDPANPPPAAALEHLESLRGVLVRLSEYERHGAPWNMRWGLYAGSDAYPEARQLYFDGFKKLLFQEAQEGLVKELKSLPLAPGPADEYGRAYNTLKAWLETTSHHEAATMSFLPPLLEERWVDGRKIDAHRRKLARTQFDFYTAALIARNPYPSDEQTEMVESARKYLAQFGGAMRVYHSMQADVDKANPPLVFTQRFPGYADIVVNTREIPSAFTKTGFDLMQEAMANAGKYAGGEEWVLGKETATTLDNSNLAPRLQALYYSEYIDQWRDYLNKSAVVKYANLKDAAAKLGAASDPKSPLLALFWLAAQNTAVKAPEVTKAFGPLQALMPAANGEQYIGPATTNYIQGLTMLKDAFEKASMAVPVSEEAAQNVRDTANAARVATRKTVEALGQDAEGHIERVIAKLLEEPVMYAEAVSPMGPDTGRLNTAGAGLCNQFRRLTSKYPFQPNAQTAATLDDVSAIFRPQEGALATFFDMNLKNLLVKQGSGYSPAPKTKTALNARFLKFFNNAMEFSKALYAAGTEPSLSFTLKPAFAADIQSVTLTIDGQTAKLNHNAAAKQFSWPGNGARMTAKGGGDYIFPTYDGLWGVFDFFNDADKPPPSPEWVLRGGHQGKPVLSPATNQPVAVHFELDMLGNPPVFQKGYLQNLVCVAQVAGR